jgi:hypothetical protein
MKLQASDYLKLLDNKRKDLLNDKYIVKPFFELINSKDFKSGENKRINIITGHMNQGKTYNVTKCIIPTLLNEYDIDVVIFGVPQMALIDEQTFINELPTLSNCNYVNNNVSQSLKYLEATKKSGKKLVITFTHSKLLYKDAGKNFITSLIESGLKFAYFFDEAHMGSTSDIKNYKENIGHTVSIYDGHLYTACSRMLEATNHVYGITATTNREMKGELSAEGDYQYYVMNEAPPIEELKFNGAFCGSVDFYDKETDTENQFESYLNWFSSVQYRLPHKQVMMVITGASNCSNGFDLTKASLVIQSHNRSMGYFPPKELGIVILSSKSPGNILQSYDGKTRQEGLTDDECLAILNDVNHPARFMLVVEKGKCGINVAPLKWIFSYRPQDKKDSKGKDAQPITEAAIQVVGRASRTYTGMNRTDFSEKYGKSWKKYVMKCSNQEYRDFLEYNSMHICVPDTTMWRAAAHDFQENRVMSKSEMIVICDKLRGNE